MLLITVTDVICPVFASTVRKKMPLPASLRCEASRDFVGFTSLSSRAGFAVCGAESRTIGDAQARSAAKIISVNRDMRLSGDRI